MTVSRKVKIIAVNLLVVSVIAFIFYSVWQKKIVQEETETDPPRAVAIKESEILEQEKISEYITQKGDTLWDIAIKIWGDGFRWQEIAGANDIQAPISLKTGTKLKIPAINGAATGTNEKQDETKLQRFPQGTIYYVSPEGDDKNNGTSPETPWRTIQKAVDVAQPGEVVNLLEGEYFQDVVTRRNGTTSAPIVITGPQTAVVRGGGNTRVIEINNSHLSLNGFTVDGLHGPSDSKSGYRDKLIYILGREARSGPVGIKVSNMTLKNAGGECLRLRYFVKDTEVAYNTFLDCGKYDFVFKGGGKNGEGVYIGTAPEQLDDGRNPTTEPDESNNNWIHHNKFDTQGNECVDIKEASRNNIVEYNVCTGQKDSESGGFDSRGDGNTFRHNEIFGNKGAGIRLGGDKKSTGINNNVYDNVIRDNVAGGIKIQRSPQGKVCGNKMGGNTGGDSVGTYGSRFSPERPC